MPHSVIDAIKMGVWDYEPQDEDHDFESTQAIPGSGEKLEVIALRAQQGLPLWHPHDRLTYEEQDL